MKGQKIRIFHIIFLKDGERYREKIVSLIFLIFIDIESSYFGNHITKYK